MELIEILNRDFEDEVAPPDSCVSSVFFSSLRNEERKVIRNSTDRLEAISDCLAAHWLCQDCPQLGNVAVIDMDNVILKVDPNAPNRLPSVDSLIPHSEFYLLIEFKCCDQHKLISDYLSLNTKDCLLPKFICTYEKLKECHAIATDTRVFAVIVFVYQEQCRRISRFSEHAVKKSKCGKNKPSQSLYLTPEKDKERILTDFAQELSKHHFDYISDNDIPVGSFPELKKISDKSRGKVRPFIALSSIDMQKLFRDGFFSRIDYDIYADVMKNSPKCQESQKPYANCSSYFGE